MFALPFSFPAQPHRLYQKTEEGRSYEEGEPENILLSPETGINAYSFSSRSSQAKPLGHSSTSRRPWRFPPYISSV